MDDTLILCNGASGGAATHGPVLEEAARAKGCRLKMPESVGEFRETVRQFVASGGRRLVIAGGDGTVNTTVTALGDRRGDIELAVIPTGTGNNLARCLGGPLDDVAAGLDWALQSPAGPMDLGVLDCGEEHFFVNAVAVGVGGEVADEVSSDAKGMWGALSYWIACIGKLGDLKPLQFDLWVDGAHSQRNLYGMIAANGPYVGGGITVAPDETPSDGLMTLTMIPMLQAIELLSASAEYLLHPDELPEGIEAVRCKQLRWKCDPAVTISLDGETLQCSEASIRILPAALRVAGAGRQDVRP